MKAEQVDKKIFVIHFIFESCNIYVNILKLNDF